VPHLAFAPLGPPTLARRSIRRLLPETQRGELTATPIGEGGALVLDFLPVSASTVPGFDTRFHLYAVPGGLQGGSARRLLLRGVDGVVFVADSRWQELRQDVASLRDLEAGLRENGCDPASLPLVLQYNKRDLADVAPLRYLDYLHNRRATRAPSFGSVARELDHQEEDVPC
jgi:signal recognition particle receptor subunit beta